MVTPISEGGAPAAGADAGAGTGPVAGACTEGGPRPTPLWTLKATQFLGTAAWACLSKFITVYYAELGVSRRGIGLLQFVGPLMSFLGQVFWGTVVDRMGEYKRPLVATTVIGSVIVLCHMLPAVQESFLLLFAVTVLWNFFLCTSPIVDAMCLSVLEEQQVTDEAYGDQRLWCAVGWGTMSLIAGQMIDVFGTPFMFLGYAFFQAINLSILAGWLPQGKRRADCAAQAAARNSSIARQLCSFDVVWLLINVFQYGVAMCLLENFLLVFLLQDFVGTTRLLMGASVAVMCAFEVPVFKYIGCLWKRRGVGLTGVIVGCQLIMVLRCWLYTLLPAQQPWLVLLVEPLHGISFAAMWAATVEYGRRLAPPGAVARMQTLVNGIFYQAAMGIGSVIWGPLVELPPRGVGFKRAFEFNAVLVLAWCTVWQAGLWARSRCSGTARPGARDLPPGSAQPLAELGAVA